MVRASRRFQPRDERPQAGKLGIQSSAPVTRNRCPGAGPTTVISLANHDEACLLQHLQVTSEVSVRQSQQSPEVREVSLASLGQHRQDSQPVALMHNLVKAERRMAGLGLLVR